MRRAYDDVAAVGLDVVDTVGDGHTEGVAAEVVVVDGRGRLGPLGPRVFERPDHLPFLRVDADDGAPLASESSAGTPDPLELPITIRGAGGGDRLLVDVKTEVECLEQPPDGAGGDPDTEATQLLADLLGGLAGPLDAADRISRRVILQQLLDLGDYPGRFFSTDLRPPPGRRMSSAASFPSSSSRLPLAMV